MLSMRTKKPQELDNGVKGKTISSCALKPAAASPVEYQKKSFECFLRETGAKSKIVPIIFSVQVLRLEKQR